MDSESLKRFLMTLATSGLIVANKKLGLGLGEMDIASLAGLVAGYVVQSGMRSAAKVKADAAQLAAEKVKTVGDANAVFNSPAPKMLPVLFAVALFAAAPVRAQDGTPADAPVVTDPTDVHAEPELVERAIEVKKGDLVPADGAFVPSAQRVEEGRRLVRCEESLKSARFGSEIWHLLAVGGAAFVLGAGAVALVRK